MLHLALKSEQFSLPYFSQTRLVGKPKIKGVEEGHHALFHGKAPEKIAQLEGN